MQSPQRAPGRLGPGVATVRRQAGEVASLQAPKRDRHGPALWGGGEAGGEGWGARLIL